MKSNWQRLLLTKFDHHFLDPRSHELKDPKNYTKWDLDAISQCDLVFAYVENDNPGVYSLCLELGYAKALGKTIILVDEKSANSESFSKYFQMTKEASDYYFTNLSEAIAFLKVLSNS